MKNIIKKYIVPAVSGPFISRLAGSILGQSVTVFMLHRMLSPRYDNPGGTTAGHLENCLRYLKSKEFHFLALEQLVDALATREPLPPRSVVFTLDDGYHDQAELAIPVFEAFDCPITFFVITGMLDLDFWPWDAQIAWIVQTTDKTALPVRMHDRLISFDLGDPGSKRLSRRRIQDYLKAIDAKQVPSIVADIADVANVTLPARPPEQYMPLNWQQARDLESSLVRFAPHSATHNILSQLDDASLESELVGCWNKISMELANPLKVFCYPTGRAEDFGTREITALERLGYSGAVSTIPAPVDPSAHSSRQRFALPRYSLPEKLEDLIQCCSWLEFLRNKYSSRLK